MQGVDVYGLPWLLHLVGDVHQPQPAGDAGGIFVFTVPNRTLHAVWDQSAGPDPDLATQALQAYRKNPGDLSPDPNLWINEGFELAESAKCIHSATLPSLVNNP